MLGSATIAHSGVKVSSRILDRYLLRGESLVVANRAHWAKLAEPVLTALAGFVLISWLSATLEQSTGSPALWLYWGWLGLVARMVWRLLEWRNEWFVATDKRLLMTYGLITHRVAMMPLRKVTDMNYARSILGRFLGYGTFTLESAGQDQAMREINWVPDPDDTYRSICDIIFVPGNRDEDDDLPEDDAPDEEADGGELAALWPDLDRIDEGTEPGWGPREQPDPADDTVTDDGLAESEGPGWEVSPAGDSAYMPVTVRAGHRLPEAGTQTTEADDPTGPLP